MILPIGQNWISDSTTRAFRELLEAQLGQFNSRLTALRPQSSNEEIHQLRVLTRRARATCQTLNAIHASDALDALYGNLRKVTRALGPIRALDVSHENLLGLSKKRVKKGEASYGFLIRALARRKTKLRKRMKKSFKKGKILHSMEMVPLNSFWNVLENEELSQGFGDQMEKSSQSVWEAWKQFQKSRDIADLHQTRIQLKKFRYLLEISSQCLSRPSEEYIKGVKKLQDRLGHIHDLEVLSFHLSHGSIKKRVRKKNKAKKKLYRGLLHDLKTSIHQEVLQFHRQGEPLLQPLLEGIAA